VAVQAKPDLFWERMQLRTSDQKGWDKIVGPLIYVSLFAWLLFTAYDAARFHWSPVPIWLQGLGVIILICSFFLFFMTFRENAYLSPLVRIQEDRGQKVISTGPYHYVRHPMYAATLIFVIGTPLLLGAWYGILVAPVVVIVLAWRAVLEENTLRKELPGYPEYMVRVNSAWYFDPAIGKMVRPVFFEYSAICSHTAIRSRNVAGGRSPPVMRLSSDLL